MKLTSEDTQVERAEAAVHIDPDARVAIERKLIRKLDARLSILVLIYLLNYLDRNNASAARLKGFEADLKLKGQQYPTVLSILYVGYIIFQIPSNTFLQSVGRPSLYLPVSNYALTIWGLISVLTGVTHNFTGAVLTRFFLGFVEAAFFPGAMHLLSRWYTKHELGQRTSILYCGSLISNAFGPLIAAGILAHMEGVRGIRAWRWLFYIEGAITIGIAILAVFILPDFPENSRGFTEEERNVAVLRVVESVKGVDSGVTDDTPLRALVSVLKDPKAWNMALTLTALTCSLTFNQFFPTLTSTLGYNRTISLLLAAPPFFVATILTFLTARHSDKMQERYFHIIVPIFVGIIGFIIAMTTRKTAPRYVALFLMASEYCSFVVYLTWISTSFPRPAMRRAIAIAFIVSFSQLGNVAGAYVFPSNWGPSYVKSYAICIACASYAVFGCTVHRFLLKRLNNKLQQEEELAESQSKGESETGEELATSVAPARGFRYCL
ncbi:MFS general substrate transporter [Meredithblackwellia eburnea MCA 4105]